MKVRTLRQYMNFAPGSTIDGMGRGVATELIRRGVVEEAVEAKAVAAPPQNKAMGKAKVRNK